MNKVTILIILVFCLLMMWVFLFSIRGGNDTSEGLPVPRKSEESKDVIVSIDELCERINEEISNGNNGTLSFYISEYVTDDDIKKINYSIDSTKGTVKSVATYTSSTGNGLSYRRVELDYEKSDTLFVYESIVEGKPIPAERTKAKQLEGVCRDVLSMNIRPEMSDYEKELAIHDYIVNSCEYGNSLSNDDSEFSAYGVLVNNRAVCSGYAAAMQLLLSCSGVESNIVTGEADSITNSSGKENHAWNQVKIDGSWYNLDATWDDPVGEEEVLAHTYFNIDDGILSRTHKWDGKKANACISMKDNYYKHNGAYFTDLPSLEAYFKTEFMGGTKQVAECAVDNIPINDESLQFLFDINGVSSVSYSTTGNTKYDIVTVYIK